MEALIGAYFAVAIIGLIIACVLAGKFADFAAEKGYERSHYFWLCFFLGMFGYVWVAALPDAALQRENAELRRQINALAQMLPRSEAPAEQKPAVQPSPAAEPPQPQRDSKTLADGQWLCPNCYILNSPNHGQCKKCGTFRH